MTPGSAVDLVNTGRKRAFFPSETGNLAPKVALSGALRDSWLHGLRTDKP